MNMADCPIFAPAAPKMPADRLGLRGTVKREYDQSSTERMTRNVDGEFNRLTTYYGCATVAFASLADSASIAYNIPVHGPLFGTHYAVRVFVNVDLDGLSMSGYVSADDRVTVVFQNDTGGAIQPASSFDVCVIVERYPVGLNTGIGAVTDAGSAGGDTVITPPIGLGSLVLTGYAPTVTASAGNIDVNTIGLGSLVLTGYEPSAITVTQNHARETGLGSLIITGYTPTVTIAAPVGDAAYFNNTALTIESDQIPGLLDGRKCTFIFYCRADSGTSTNWKIYDNNDGIVSRPLLIQRRDTKKVRVTAGNFRIDTTHDLEIDGTTWYEVMGSFDRTEAASANCHMYVDDTSSLAIDTYTDETINWGATTVHAIGGGLKGCLKGVAIWFNTFLDLSNSSNRTDLRNYDIGVTPDIYQDMVSEPASAFLTNRGSGEDFVETGVGDLEICSTAP